MNTTTTTTWPGCDVVTPALGRPAAMRLAETEYHRVLDTVDALRPDDWSRSTDCTAWDVRQLVAHITGMAKFVSTPWEMARQVRAAKTRRHDGQQLITPSCSAVLAIAHLEVRQPPAANEPGRWPLGLGRGWRGDRHGCRRLLQARVGQRKVGPVGFFDFIGVNVAPTACWT